jgi:hypothetical protein
MSTHSSVLTGHSCAADPRQAVAEFRAAVAQPHMALVLFFCSSEYDLTVLGEAMARAFEGVQVVGCTTAGEIGPAGCRDHSISGVSFGAADFAAVSGHIDRLRQFEPDKGQAFARNLLRRLERGTPGAEPGNSFALLLIDGLSMREELVTRWFQDCLGQIPLVGGSAGDGSKFQRTQVFSEGRFHDDSAALILLSTPLPSRIFKTQHFVPTDKRIVVTAADPARRIVTEIDGYPAAVGYARMFGVDASAIDGLGFADNPVVVLIDGANYVRSIQKINADGSLTFYCAIDEGVVLRQACGIDLVQNLHQAFARIDAEIGPPELIIGFDCVLRKREILHHGLGQQVDELLRRNQVIGFNTYGEQFHSVHVNQTFTGVALGSPVKGRNHD